MQRKRDNEKIRNKMKIYTPPPPAKAQGPLWKRRYSVTVRGGR